MPSEPAYQNQQQTPINGTISRMAPPGNETGYYYIPIANVSHHITDVTRRLSLLSSNTISNITSTSQLPWQTSWQELKDHVRTVCSVEHVEINDNNGGHVILKGRANFDAAFRLLNGGIFHDRALIADGRNADSWVLVKHHVDGLMPQSAPGYGEWPATSASPSYMMSPVMSSSPYFVPYTMPEYTDSAVLSALEHSLASAVPFPASPAYTHQITPSEYYENSYTISHNNMASRERERHHVDAVLTKRRKIIIRQLQPWANESQIRGLISHKAGIDSGKLQKLDMPLADGQQGVNRGYVIATFESEETADKVIKRLNNYQYDGRVLEVKHTKEGVSDDQPSHGSRSIHRRHFHHSRRERHEDKDRKGKEKENSHRAVSSNQKGSKSFSSESDVIIAHGSSLSYA
ncbi:hypothetical protein FHL15_004234 [Xylaria flabelliformis]|uniref:RRM domain-containing protein n=1 Tax=Xylaria flabelliformis TaxID=2512241 RepID=A0A553I3K1_9PEZI|nr:hypothetical protein FHL15_004234 [Xylaria flabelliformis]